MPAPRGFTPNLSRIKDWADEALTSPDGVTLRWRVPEFSLAAAAQHSRGFQTSFTSLRAKARRQKIIHTGSESEHALDLFTRGPYDSLACVREPLANSSGWTITLCRAHDMFQGVEVTNARTGEPIVGETAEDREMGRIIMKAQQFPNAVTPEEWDLVEAKKRPSGTSQWFITDTERWFHRPGGEVRPKVVGQDHLLPEVGNLFGPTEEGG